MIALAAVSGVKLLRRGLAFIMIQAATEARERLITGEREAILRALHEVCHCIAAGEELHERRVVLETTSAGLLIQHRDDAAQLTLMTIRITVPVTEPRPGDVRSGLSRDGLFPLLVKIG